MIFRAPLGHMLLSKAELASMKERIDSGDHKAAADYLSYCVEEVDFYDNIRKRHELKKMHQDDGDLEAAAVIDKENKELMRERIQRTKLLKSAFLS